MTKHELSASGKKVCTTCLSTLPLSDFYSKGNRQDSCCKKCKKQKSKTTYLKKKKIPNIEGIKRFITLVVELECKRLQDFENELSIFINERRKNV